MVKGEILIANYYTLKERDEVFRYLYENLRNEPYLKAIQSAKQIMVNDFRIRLMSNESKHYRGRRPEYYYGYGTDFMSYMNAIGAKRLNSLEEVINLVKQKGE